MNVTCTKLAWLVVFCSSGAITAYGSDPFKNGTSIPVQGGPGQGSGGIAINDVPVEVAQFSLTALVENVANMTDSLGDLTGTSGGSQSKSGIMEEIQKAMGEPIAGEEVSEFKPKIDPVARIARGQLLASLKTDGDQETNTPFILYLNALDAHEARMQLYYERLNLLIGVNKERLNWQQRIKLQSQVGLLAGQLSIAQQEMRDVANQAKIAGHRARMEHAVRAQQKRERQKTFDAIMSVH